MSVDEVGMGGLGRRVDTSDLEAVKAAVGLNTKLVIMESPTNPRIQISDIRVCPDLDTLTHIRRYFWR